MKGELFRFEWLLMLVVALGTGLVTYMLWGWVFGP